MVKKKVENGGWGRLPSSYLEKETQEASAEISYTEAENTAHLIKPMATPSPWQWVMPGDAGKDKSPFAAST